MKYGRDAIAHYKPRGGRPMVHAALNVGTAIHMALTAKDIMAYADHFERDLAAFSPQLRLVAWTVLGKMRIDIFKSEAFIRYAKNERPMFRGYEEDEAQ